MSTKTPVTLQFEEVSKLPGCDKYRKYGERLKVLTLFFTVRAMFDQPPTFAEFLRNFAATLGDADEKNLKHPEDALAQLCPRGEAAAEKVGRAPWTAESLYRFLENWITVLDECRATGQKAPAMEFKTFLDVLGPRFLAGEFDPPAAPSGKLTPVSATPGPVADYGGAPPVVQPLPPPVLPPPVLPPQPPQPLTQPPLPYSAAMGEPGFTRDAVAAGLSDVELHTLATSPTPNDVRPTQVNQRVVYYGPAGAAGEAAALGTVQSFAEHDGRTYVTVQLDNGEVVQNAAIASFKLVPGATAARPKLAGEARFTFQPAELSHYQNLLDLELPVANAAAAAVLYRQSVSVLARPGMYFNIEIVNGDRGPVVYAELVSAVDGSPQVLGTSAPRKRLVGAHRVDVNGDVYQLSLA